MGIGHEVASHLRDMASRKSRRRVDVEPPFLRDQRHGLPLLNADKPSQPVGTLLRMSKRGEVALEEVPLDAYRVPGLEGYTVIPQARIVVTDAGRKAGIKTDFEGHFVGEEFSGETHPLLLIPPDRVEPLREYRDRSFGQEE